MLVENVLRGLRRCPHCGVAAPTMEQQWKSDFLLDPPYQERWGRFWLTYKCTSCSYVILVATEKGNKSSLKIEKMFPASPKIDDELPEMASRFLQQAIDSLYAPDGAAMLAGSAVDAMLKAKGLLSGSLYERIEEAVKEGILTKDMGDWAHDVRLGSNRPRHADEAKPHVSLEEARQSVEFAKTLGLVLFTLPARVSRGKAAAEATDADVSVIKEVITN